MSKNNNSSKSKADRKTIEKNRRNQMKNLYFQLHSLVPSSSQEALSVPDQIDEATNYIRQLQENVEGLRQQRDGLLGVERSSSLSSRGFWRNDLGPLKSPVQVEVHVNGTALEVILVTALDSQFVFNEVIRILDEEQAEVVNASYSVVEANVFHTIHAQMGVEAAVSNGGARITERLQRFAL